MKEIKFRAWDKITSRWLNDYNDLWLNLEGKVFFMTTTGGYEGHDYLKKLDAEVCLYTGLKDKNGKSEVYEGDIISLQGNIIGNKYENENLLKDNSNLLIEGLGTIKWKDTEQEAYKRGCKYAE